MGILDMENLHSRVSVHGRVYDLHRDRGGKLWLCYSDDPDGPSLPIFGPVDPLGTHGNPARNRSNDPYIDAAVVTYQRYLDRLP